MSTAAASNRSISAAAADPRGLDPLGRLRLYAAIAAGSFVSYILYRLTSGGASTAFAVFGLGACGWAWLLARALFEPPGMREAWWPRIVVVIVAVSGALAALVPASGVAGRVIGNLYLLSGSAALLLTFVEPFNRYSSDLPSSEMRFRLAFVGVYALLVAASVLGLWAASGEAQAARMDNLIKSGCAIVSLCGATAAVWYRLRHPLTGPGVVRRVPTPEDRRLAERLMRLLREEGIDGEPDLKIGDVAQRLGEPEYRVSQCISAALGFANFNRLINHHRIERAKTSLSDPGDARSILQIAFDCGFGSIGPFNRAFKDQVGTTPRDYRRAASESARGR